MPIWEYKVINTNASGVPLCPGKDMTYASSFEAGLNELGEDGWKLCGVEGHFLIFVREKKKKGNLK